jgi:2-polyprenyl-6-methoxyphenol hydroxylase-like FAD-dependent oxidoreductase
VIVGGGIGGLTAAVALRATRALGLAEPVGRIAARISGISALQTTQDASVIADIWPRRPTLGVHRADLVAVLVAALSAGVVHTGHRCTQFTQHDGSATMPPSGLSMPARHLPDPDGPDTTTNSPAETEM